MSHGKNFNNFAKQLLIDLVKQNKIIENKKTDACTSNSKKKAWVKLAEEFNLNCGNIGSKRDSEQLKKLWKNLKAKAKHDESLRKRELRKTGLILT